MQISQALISLFSNLFPMPMSHLVDHMTVDYFFSNEAKWHKSCHNKFFKDRLERLKKEKEQTLQ